MASALDDDLTLFCFRTRLLRTAVVDKKTWGDLIFGTSNSTEVGKFQPPFAGANRPVTFCKLSIAKIR
jgi:hypothetical protein